MKNLKKFLLIVGLPFLSISCLDDEPVHDNVTFHYKQIDSVHIEQINPIYQVTKIKTFFTKNNSCEHFADYDYGIFGNIRHVTMITAKFNDQACNEIAQVDSAYLNFRPEQRGNYIFKFWAGNDENNEPIFIEKEIYIP